MKKKLMVLCMLLCSVFGVLACKSNPYENMTVKVYHEQEELKGGEVVNLDIKMGNGGGYVYGQTVIRVEVDDDDKDTDKSVSISGGEGYVTLTKDYDSFMGVTSITVQTTSSSRTGKFSLTITTNAGNKTRVVDFNVDRALENFEFKSGGLTAIGKGSTASIANLSSLIDFYPEDTTQRNIDISLAEFEPSGVSGLYYIKDWNGDTNAIKYAKNWDGYTGSFEFEFEENGTYASIKNSVITTYSTTKDLDGEDVDVNYPKMIISATEGYTETQEVIVLKASFTSPNGTLVNDKFLVVPVVSVCKESDVTLTMNTEGDGAFDIPKAEDGTYEMVFVYVDLATLSEHNLNLGDSELNSYLDYCLDRELNFDVPKDYVVKANNVNAEDGYAVSIAGITSGSQAGSFTIHAENVGTYIHEFSICHKDYPDIFSQKISVKFIVKDIPTGVTINGTQNAGEYSIYNIYANGKGEKFSIKLNTTVGKYKYFVFMENYDDFDKLSLKTTNTDNEMVFAKLNDGVISSASNEKAYTTFDPESVFYVKHSYEYLPTENAKMGIGVIVDLCADSYYSTYSSEQLESMFGHLLYGEKFDAKFEMSISQFDFLSSDYYIDLTNEDKIARVDSDGEVIAPENGVVICALPEGQTLESCIGKNGVTYNKNLITIYSYVGDDGITSIMAKCNSERLEGVTKVNFQAKNGVTGSVTISTFMPTIYKNHTEDNKIPLGISVDKSSEGYLYMVSGYTGNGDDVYKDISNHETTLSMLDSTGGVIGNYSSLHTLYGIVGKKINLSFLDFTYIDGEFESYDITSKTSKLKITFSNDGYASYNGGVLSLKRLVTDPNTPLVMRIEYTGGYEDIDGNGVGVYNEIDLVHEVKIYIYNPLERVEVLSKKSVNLYVSDNLSYFDRTDPVDGSETQNLSKNTIEASLSPIQKNLGSDWNELFGVDIATSLQFAFSSKDEKVKDANGNAVVLKPNSGSKTYELTYGDIFDFKAIDGATDYVYKCVVECRLSEDLLSWLKYSYNFGANITSKTMQNFLNRYIYGKDFSVEVEIYGSQFGKLSNRNTVEFVCCYAPKITEFKLITYDDGVYFDVRDIAKSSSDSAYTFEYSIDTADCLNKEIIVEGGETEHFSTRVVVGAGKTGQITITPKSLTSGGLYNLRFILKDNIKGVDEDGKYEFYDSSLNQEIRVKVADGSKDYPFEIKDSSDYVEMLGDIKSANTADDSDSFARYFYYILTRDIDLGDTTIETIDVLRSDKGHFSLTGEYSYYRNGEEIKSYNKINNLKIDRKIESLQSNVYVGLFGRLGTSVDISNVSIENVSIRVYSSSSLSGGFVVGVGAFAGSIEGATLKGVSALGNVVVNLDAENATICVGGLVGLDGVATNTSQIINYPTNIVDSLVSSKNNVYIEISLSGKAKAMSAGGVIGKLSSTKIDTLQVVSNISSTMTAQKENIGGAIGEMNYNGDGKEANILQVSPVITVSGNSENGNYGGVVGLLNAGAIKNAIVYFVNAGDAVSFKNKINISITNVKSVCVGGIVGLLEGSGAKEIGYSYVRSFYNSDIKKNSYAGNIVVTDTTSGYVGGVAGYVGVGSGSVKVRSSYFDGDIMIDGKDEVMGETHNFVANLKAGLMFGGITKGEVTNSYAVGRIYVDLTTEDKSSGEKQYSYGAISNYTTKGGIIGSAEYKVDSVSVSVVGRTISISYPKVYSINNVTFNSVYGVLNEKNVYVGIQSAMLMGDDSSDLVTNVNNAVSTATYGFVDLNLGTPLSLFKTLGFSMTDGVKVNDGDVASNYAWFYSDKVNVIDGNIYPIPLNNGLAMYDLIPSGIDVIINGSVENIYDISYVEGEGSDAVRHNQMIMYAKVDKNGNYSSDYYEILIDRNDATSDKASVKVVFEGDAVMTDLVHIPLDDKIEIVLVENGSGKAVVNLKNNRIYPRNEGEAVIEIRSYLDKTIKTSILVKVINIVEGFELYEIVDSNEYELDDVGYVYVDETSSYSLKTYSEKYVSTKNVGYILEMLPSEVGVNGSFKLDGVEYSYKEEDNNLFKISGESIFRVAGVQMGYVNFKLTPYLALGSVYYCDEYSGKNGTSLGLNNAYILDELGKEFTLLVRARAKSAENTAKNASITSKNGFDFVSTIETSNVTQNASGKYVFLEDIYVDISLGENLKINYKALSKIDLLGFDEVEELNKVYYFSTPYLFEYDLINLKITGLSVKKTDVDPVTRKNTYKISLYLYVSFDKEYYRANANVYDLNNVNFTVSLIPDSNIVRTEGGVAYALLDGKIKGSTVIGITPSTLTDIFMNYYSRGEGLLSNTENTYPSDNESNNIVPGREGLLKITLAEEFSNSSYVTLTLNKSAYAGYVKIEQMAGVMSSVYDEEGGAIGTEFDEYQELIYQEYVETDEVYGIKLQKLTCNSGLDTYFNNTYFVKITLSKEVNYNVVGSAVTLVATSYISSYTSDTENLARTKSLTISPLPSLNAQIEGSNNVFMGVGVKKEMDIRYSHLTNDIEVTCSEVVSSGSSETETRTDDLFVVDDNGEMVGESLSLAYLNSGRKYYLALTVEAYEKLGSFDYYSVQLSAREYVEGRTEDTVSRLIINPVEYEVEKIELVGTDYNEESRQTELNIYHGQSIVLRTNVTYVPIVVGDANKILEYKQKLETYYGDGGSETFSSKELLEYSLAGTTVTKTGGGIVGEETLSKNNLMLYRVSYLSGKENLEDISRAGIYGGIEILYNDYKSNSDADNVGTIYTINYALLRGLSISTNNLLRMSLPYHYEDGKVIAGASLSGTYFEEDIYFYVNIKDDSTETHPVPIENQEDLMTYAGNSGHYILVNNITLTNWTPIEALFDSLDGNGYTISIMSFNMSLIRGSDDVNAGIFTTISETTLIKNLTIDVGNLLVSSTTMLNDAKIISKSTASTYTHDQAGKIDLTFVTSVNFGVLAGTNNGSLTNIKVVNTKNFGKSDSENKYLHILTSQIDSDGNQATSNIGGIVGVNSSTGAITNSFVGLNDSTETVVTLGSGATETRYYIQTVKSPNSISYNNIDDKMESVRVYPFVIAGQNKIAGVATENAGTISNTYTKGLGVYNTSTIESGSVTAGLVGTNTNLITSSFVEGGNIEGYRATGLYDGESERRDIIEAVGYVSGLVYENTSSGLIENSYANVYLETQSTFIAGFVFKNQGAISSSYSTSVNGNNLAYGPFSGILERVSQNSGKYENCYYLVLAGESENDHEDATPMYAENFETADGVDIKLSDFWKGFSFASQSGVGDEDGIWTIRDGLPKNSTTLTDTNSFRILSEIEEIENEDGSSNQQYSYLYDSAYQEGTKGNPLVIESADNFDSKIISRGRKVGDDYIFGANGGNGILGTISAVEYVRLANNIDFTDRTYANKIDGVYLYDTIFAGKLDGNGMTMKNLHIETENTDLDDFGIFRQVGIDSSKASSQTVIKNLNITVASYKGSNTKRAGILAGTIKNANIINVNIDGGGVTVSAYNMAGTLAGLVLADGANPVSIVDVEISNIVVASQYSSIGNAIDDYSQENSGGRYKEFQVKDKESGAMKSAEFVGLEVNYQNDTLKVENPDKVSYAGIVSGVLVANNTDFATKLAEDDSSDIEAYRSGSTTSSITNIVVSGYFKISNADNAGGLFGYLSENSRIKNCKVVLGSSEQLIKSRNYAGGLIGENHGIIEQCSIAYADSAQSEYDKTIGDYSLTRNNGKVNLFYQDVDNFYNVAVGGIAGYSENGAIIDSYSKVNVVQPNTFISGGLLGYSQSFNYIGFSYATGAVYSRKYMGGLVGLQITESTDYKANNGANAFDKILHLNIAIALNDWDTYKSEISSILYNNYKSLYQNESGFDNFYLKLAEVGNQGLSIDEEFINNYIDLDVELIETLLLKDIADADKDMDGIVSEDEAKTAIKTLVGADDTNYDEKVKEYYINNYINTLAKSYENGCSKFVGSVIGASYSYEIIDEAFGDDYDNYKNNTLFIYDEYLSKLYSSSEKVFSTTYGGMSVESGSLDRGNRVDTYFGKTFNMSIGTDQVMMVYSYRIPYIGSDISYNNYNALTETEFGMNFNYLDTKEYLDKVNFQKVFMAQEYTEELLGTFYQVDVEVQVKTTNIFRGYSADRFSSVISERTFVEEVDSVWELNSKDYLPVISDGSVVSFEKLYAFDDDDRLKAVFNSSADDKTYYLNVGTNKPGVASDDNEFTITVDGDNINYMSALRSVFIGKSSIIGGKVVRPKIVFNIPSDSRITTIFGNISGAVFSNVDIVINVQNELTVSSKEYDGFGVFANSLQGASLSDVSLTINLANSPTFNSLQSGIEGGAQGKYEASASGIVFGQVNNSVIKNSSITINNTSDNRVVLNNSTIENFGLVAGLLYRSNFEDVEFNIASTTIDINNVSSGVNIGGLFGKIQNSNLVDYIISGDKASGVPNMLTFEDRVPSSAKNIGGLVGYAQNSKVEYSDTTKDGYFEAFKVEYSDEGAGSSLSSGVATILNIGAISGYSYSSTYIGMELFDSEETDGYVLDIKSTTSVGLGYDDTTSKVSVGAIIGADLGGSVVGSLSDNTLVGNNYLIKVQANTYSLYAGGLVGSSVASTKIYNSYNLGDIEVKNSREGAFRQKYDSKGLPLTDSKGNLVYEITYADTFVGGIIGYTKGNFVATSVLSSGDVKICGASGSNTYRKMVMGGIVGQSSSVVTLKDFAVISDFEVDAGFNSVLGVYSYASGIIGYNTGRLSAKDGYTYCEFDYDSSYDTGALSGVFNNLVYSATTNGSISEISNVFYPREFVGNNYTTDSKFEAFAFADILGEVNPYGALYALKSTNMSGTLGVSGKVNVALPITETLSHVYVDKLNDSFVTLGDNRFALKTISASDSGTLDLSGVKKYTAIITDGTISYVDTLSEGYYVSGKSTETGKVTITSSGTASGSSVFGTNNGVISNIYFNTVETSVDHNGNTKYTILSKSLVGTNNGLITGIYMYNKTNLNYTMALTNNGEIYGSASANIYCGALDEFYVFAYANIGVIADCYSSSAGYVENDTRKVGIYMVNSNKDASSVGTISNSFYYIPSLIESSNTISGFHKVEKGADKTDIHKGNTYSCYSGDVSKLASTRSSIWTTENGHTQLKGIKDISGAMNIHIYYNKASTYNYDTAVEVTTLRALHTQMSNSSSNYVFSYRVGFYEDDKQKPKYNVVRISDGVGFAEYLNSLASNQYKIPANTVVAIFGSIELDGTIPAFSLARGSMLAGLYYKEAKNGGQEYTKSTINFANRDYNYLKHELITENNGIIANVIINNLTIKIEDRRATFAPITSNSGVINGLQFASIQGEVYTGALNIDAVYTTYVAGLVLNNLSSGKIYNVSNYGMVIQTNRYYVVHIYNNEAGLSGLRNVTLNGSLVISRASGELAEKYVGGKAYN